MPPAVEPETTTENPHRGSAVPSPEARHLAMMTRKITDAEALWDRRAASMSRLWAEGFSLDAIATAAGVTREAVRKSVLRWRKRAGHA